MTARTIHKKPCLPTPAVTLIVAALAALQCFAAPACAQTGGKAKSAPAGVAQIQNTATNEPGKLEATADEMESDKVRLRASGNVVIKRWNEVLTADYVDYNRITDDCEAIGNVVLKRGGSVWKGPRLKYNFRTKAGLAREFSGSADEFHILASNITRYADGSYLAHTSKVTTCTNKFDHPHYHVRARTVEVTPGDSLTAYNSLFFLGPVPIMYMPFWHKNLDGDSGFRFYAGASSRMGVFLLSSYRYRLAQMLKAETHLDYRTKRGWAAGQDFRWQDPEGKWKGELTGYYADDQEPTDAEDEGELIESDRYRMLLKHSYNPTSRDSFLFKANYLSDTDILEDFFEDEYRGSSQPDNYASYTHREDDYTVNAIVRGRINDFYSTVNRMPEISVDFTRQQIGDTVLYYEGQTAAAYLQAAYSESELESGREDYSCFRVDSSHMGLYPNKQFGFLNLIPRAGYRATYYSALPQTVYTEVVTPVTITDSNGVTSTSNEISTVSEIVDRDGELRSIFELGCEASFKAYKTWENRGGPMRHVVEPYLNYTYVPEPDVAWTNLYQFDEVDRLDKNHSVKVGLRNKLQTKKESRASDLVDVDVYSIVNMDPEVNEEAFDYVYWDAEITPFEEFVVDIDGAYSTVNSELHTLNTKLIYRDEDILATELEYRFRNGSSTIISEDTTFYLTRRWWWNIYGRYEFEESRVEEVGTYIQRNYDCMAFRLGGGLQPGYTKTTGTEVEDEWRVTIEFWLTAFPDIRISGRHRE